MRIQGSVSGDRKYEQAWQAGYRAGVLSERERRRMSRPRRAVRTMREWWSFFVVGFLLAGFAWFGASDPAAARYASLGVVGVGVVLLGVGWLHVRRERQRRF